MTKRQVRYYWKRIDAWLDCRVPKMWLESPGLSESQIRAAENIFGYRLPPDLRESYMIHNGLAGVEIVPRHNIGFFLPLVLPKKTWPTLGRRHAIESWV